MMRTCALLTVAGMLAACSPAPTGTRAVALSLPTEAAGAAVVRRAVPEPPVETASPLDVTAAGIAVPPNAIYVCVTETNGVRQSIAIEFSPKVGALCTKNPEMGPCQYERNACRHSGGRVYAANGVEITMAMEAEYDRKVMRVRLKSN